MPGLYTHDTAAAGTVVTATRYNDDHENHVTNHIPSMMDDDSPSVAGMKLATDPYPGSSESLATSLEGELRRIRYILRQHLQNVQAGAGTEWYHEMVGEASGFYTYGCHVKRDALYELANAAWTAIPFNLEEEDFTAYHDLVTNNERITIPNANLEGKYLITGCVQFTGHATGYRGLRIVREVAVGPSTEIIAAQVLDVDAAATPHCLTVSTICHLLINDYITLEAYQNSTATNDLTLQAEYAPRFMAWRIGR